jgi:ELWxxDGT repeat protein
MTQYLLYDRDGLFLTDGTRHVAIGAHPVGLDRLDLAAVQALGGLTFINASGSNEIYTIERFSAEIRLVDDRGVSENGIGDYWEPGDVAAIGSGFLLAGAWVGGGGNNSLYRYDPDSGLTLVAEGLWLPLSADMVTFAGKVFFSGGQTSPFSRTELFVSDGTAGGTGLFHDFFPLATNIQGGVDLDSRWIIGDRMVMTAADGYGTRGIFATGPASGSTEKLPVAAFSKHLTDLVRYDDRIYLTSIDNQNEHALWVTDGSAAGSVRVADEAALIASSPYAGLPYSVLVGGSYQSGGGILIDEISTPFEVAGRLYIAVDARQYSADRPTMFFEVAGNTVRYVGQNLTDGFWYSDLDRGITTGLGGVLLLGDGPSSIQKALYLADPATGGAGAEKLVTLAVGEGWQQTFDLGDRVIIVTSSGGTAFRRILSTDGTAAGTVEIDARSSKSYLRQAGDKLYWQELDDLWVTDGTLAGTRMLIEGTYQDGDPLPLGMVELDPLAFATLGTNRHGTSGNDRLKGTAAADVLMGLSGNDTLTGRDRADMLFGHAGDDLLAGGTGDDLLVGGLGADRLEGGDGFDTASYRYAATGVTADLLASGANTGEAAGDVYVSVEGLEGGDGDDLLSGNRLGNSLRGGEGNDTLDGRQGSDSLFGGAGDDQLIGGEGADRFDGGDGFDTVSYAALRAAVTVDLETQAANAGGAAGDSFIRVEAIMGGAAADRLSGNAGLNRLDGKSGDDVLDGRGGNDQLFGGRGADLLIGGPGNDLLVGGQGADLFRFDPGAGKDRILGFEDGIDHIWIASGVTDISGVSIKGASAGTVLRFAGVTVTLVGHDPSLIGQDDFLFG